MPSLPLYTPNVSCPDASHLVTAPGGYERWYFDAECAGGGMHLVASFAQGWVDRPDYRQCFDRYLRSPTRRKPPIPADFASVSFAVYERAHPLAGFSRRYGAGEFGASVDRVELFAGANRVTTGADGSLHLRLRDEGTSADVVFRPLLKHPPHELDVSSSAGDGPSVHRWVVSRPLCAVEGVINNDASGRGGSGRIRDVSIKGLGYHDHDYGTAPVLRSVAGRLRGRVLTETGSIAFTAFAPDGAAGAAEARWLEAGAGGFHEPATTVHFETPNDSGASRFPRTVRFEPAGVRISGPQVLDASTACTRLLYEVSNTGSRDFGARNALCEWVRRPVLNRFGAWFVRRDTRE